MCLILVAVKPRNDLALVVAANRDEFYARPATQAGFWKESPDMLAGRDVEAGGTWLGFTKSGRFAAVTNFQEEPPSPLPPRSRGDLPTGFLASQVTPDEFIDEVAARGDEYRGFNLLVWNGDALGYYCNRTGERKHLGAGCYGLGNRVLDCDWPKVSDGRQGLAEACDGADAVTSDAWLDGFVEEGTGEGAHFAESLFELLMEPGDTREFSGSFLSSDEYGTRAATVLIVRANGQALFEERSFEAQGKYTGTKRFAFSSV